MAATLRIIRTVALKDILDSLRNRVTLTVILGVFSVALTAQIFPLLLQSSNITVVEVYDSGTNEALLALGGADNLRVSRMGSIEQLGEGIQDGNASTVGLVLPEDLDANLARGEPVNLEGRVVFWAGATRRGQQVIAGLEDQLSQAWGVPISIAVQPVYPLSTTGGHFGMVIIGLTVAVFGISAILVPILLLEERETRTLDAMLLSPARGWQVITGKALAGMVYGLVTAGILLYFNRYLVINWSWVLSGTLLTIVLSVGIGLLLGLMAQDQQGVNAWVSLVFAVGFVPVMVISLGLALPAWIEQLMVFIPTISYGYILQAGMVIDVPASQVLWWLVLLGGWTAAVYTLLVLRMRRLGL
jgi:ABC-2 type transport system permease protein